MNHQWNMFCKGLKRANYDKALQIWVQLENEGHAQPELKVNTKDVFKKQFTMAEIAKNDYAVEQLNEMEAS